MSPFLCDKRDALLKERTSSWRRRLSFRSILGKRHICSDEIVCEKSLRMTCGCILNTRTHAPSKLPQNTSACEGERQDASCASRLSLADADAYPPAGRVPSETGSMNKAKGKPRKKEQELRKKTKRQRESDKQLRQKNRRTSARHTASHITHTGTPTPCIFASSFFFCSHSFLPVMCPTTPASYRALTVPLSAEPRPEKRNPQRMPLAFRKEAHLCVGHRPRAAGDK
ncbi:hypothetical protein TRSC58_07427 [Trypanosoma rangeli SC58]|uniref:Uncharacterized protein n=1 Tax=Trypanosoma rangeli SC58 TaxID=429131 RepID=A0A061ISU8_TRYRA|nr:hypothetical protein TRSC58_07427 [Trypanosoma rangeli SC58]